MIDALMTTYNIVAKARKAEADRDADVTATVLQYRENVGVDERGLMLEAALQYGAEFIDDDAEVIVMTADALTDFLTVVAETAFFEATR